MSDQGLQDWFAYADKLDFANIKRDYHETVNKSHGRIEIRRCWALSDPIAFDYIRNWQGISIPARHETDGKVNGTGVLLLTRHLNVGGSSIAVAGNSSSP